MAAGGITSVVAIITPRPGKAGPAQCFALSVTPFPQCPTHAVKVRHPLFLPRARRGSQCTPHGIPRGIPPTGHLAMRARAREGSIGMRRALARHGVGALRQRERTRLVTSCAVTCGSLRCSVL